MFAKSYFAASNFPRSYFPEPSSGGPGPICTGSGRLYVESGSIKFQGGDGTVLTIPDAAAAPESTGTCSMTFTRGDGTTVTALTTMVFTLPDPDAAPLDPILPDPDAAPLDPSPFDPASIAGLKLWLRADALGLADGAAVATWPDSSGAGHDFTQDKTAARPTYRAGQLNGKPVVRFDGLDDSLIGGNLSATFPTAATLFVVVTLDADVEYCVYKTEFNGNRWRWVGDGRGYFGVFRESRLDGYPAAMPTSGTKVVTVESGPTGYEVFLDGASQGVQAAGYNGGTYHQLGATDLDAFNGDIAEVLIYNRVLSEAERVRVEQQYLGQKYGIS